jgi:hypothetical protein
LVSYLQKSAAVTWYLRAVLCVAAGLAIMVALRHVDLHGIGAVLAGASVALFGVAIALNVLGRVAARARRTQVLLGGRLTFAEVVQLNLAGYAAAAVLPGPAEDAVCCAQLARRRGFAPRELAKYQLTDKSLGVVSMALVALALVPPVLAIAAAVATIAAIAILARHLLVPLGWLVVSNLLCVAMIALCMTAVGGQVTALGCVEVFCATALATSVPFMPGHVGTLETAFVLAAVHLGIAAPVALAAAVLYHVAQVVPTAIVGLPALLRLSWRPACA